MYIGPITGIKVIVIFTGFYHDFVVAFLLRLMQYNNKCVCTWYIELLIMLLVVM